MRSPTRTLQIYYVLMVIVCSVTHGDSAAAHPHQPFRWTLTQWDSQTLIQTQLGPRQISFNASLCTLAPIEPCMLEGKGWYFCPSSNPGKGYCNYPNSYYCAYWGCETIAYPWLPDGDKHIKVGWGPYGCNPPNYDSQFGRRGVGPKVTCKWLYINITQPQDSAWLVGKTWGIRYWESGTDRGGLIFIKKEPVPNDPQPIGPNPVINQRNLPSHNQKNSTNITNNLQNTPQRMPSDPNDLWELAEKSYYALNATNPNLTKHCWLCYDSRPPFYEAIAINGKGIRSNDSNPTQCKWGTDSRTGITLAQITGVGTCIGQVPPEKQSLCNETMVNPSADGEAATWLLPVDNTHWVCASIGVTPCLPLKGFNTTDYCIQAMIVPRITYRPGEYVIDHNTVPEHHLTEREPITAITIATLLALGATGAGTGIASLVQQGREFSALRTAVDEDLAKIENSITALETSLRSLSEVVLQNRRGLEILLAHEGGLCVALNEECCVYADHTGVVRDAMSELRKRLEKRKRERETARAWYESWFQSSPWLTTLLSTITGPLVTLILILTFSPYVFNRLIEVVKSRLKAVHLLPIRTQYETISVDNHSDDESLALSSDALKRFSELNGYKERGEL